MDHCLYAPTLGYYATGHEKLGAQGDFITAPHVSPLFSQCIARQAIQILQDLGDGDILEFGAGTGIMASDILLFMAQQQCLPKHYFILEISPDLQQRQQQTIAKRCPEFADRVIWLTQLPTEPFRGVMLANEVLDAMPVHRFAISQHQQQIYYVTKKKHDYAWHLCATEKESELNERISQIQQTNFNSVDNFSSEISVVIPSWLQTVSETLQQGALLIIDYGFPEHEYYHLQRSMGTLMCHYQHRAHDNPLIYPGLQDITSHVDFTLVANSALESGLDVLGYTTQGFFLLACGILDLIPNSPTKQIQANQAIKKLTLPHEMGELFKVMALGRGVKKI